MEFLGTSGFTFIVDLMITDGGDILRNSLGTLGNPGIKGVF